MHPRIRVAIAEDRLSAAVEILPGEGPTPTQDELRSAVAAAGVVHGVLPRRLELALRCLDEDGALPRPVRVAEGTPASAGVPAQIAYLVEREPRPGRVDELDGSIDYTERRWVCNVAAGQAIGCIVPPRLPADGVGVDGSGLAAPPLQDLPPALGENVILRERLGATPLLESAIDGVLRVAADGAPAVVELLEIDGDVDLSTGNIDASGSVRIAGTVRSGFRVRARWDVYVGEFVEAALVEAGGDVVVRMGVLGGESWISAGGRVAVGFLQNARVRCLGNVDLLAATGSTVLCGGDLRAPAPRGQLRGGRYAAEGDVRVQEIGSELGIGTKVFAGGNPSLTTVLRELRGRIAALLRDLSPRGEDPAPPAAQPVHKRAPQVLVERRTWRGADVCIGRSRWVCEDQHGRRRFREDDL